MEPKHNSNNIAAAGMICGIIGLICSFIPIVCYFTWLLCILAVIFGIKGKKKFEETGDGKGMALTGLITGIIGIVFTIAQIACAVACTNALVNYSAQ